MVLIYIDLLATLIILYLWNAPMSSSELPKIVSKSPVEIEAAIPAIESSNLPPDIKDFVISCIRLSIWPPSELLNHQITVANLRKLVFGRDDKNKRNKQSNSNVNKCSKEKSAKN